MRFLFFCLFLPTLRASVAVRIHRSAIYRPISSCAFLCNVTLSTSSSIESCIWECVYDNKCQTAVYFSEHKICSMFAESCQFENILPSVSTSNSVICYPKGLEPSTACSSTVSTNQVSTKITESVMMTSSMSSTVATCVMETITRASDTITSIYNTTAGGDVGGINGLFVSNEGPNNAIDNLTSTKYYNFADNSRGIGTGFYVTPSISNATVAKGLLFATGNDCEVRDPIAVTLEGSNEQNITTLNLGLSWTLIYNGTTGIDPSVVYNRSTYVTQQNFSNTIAYTHYRLLITSIRNSNHGVQYSEAQIIGCV